MKVTEKRSFMRGANNNNPATLQKSSSSSSSSSMSSAKVNFNNSTSSISNSSPNSRIDNVTTNSTIENEEEEIPEPLPEVSFSLDIESTLLLLNEKNSVREFYLSFFH